jgi:hypothetical protein
MVRFVARSHYGGSLLPAGLVSALVLSLAGAAAPALAAGSADDRPVLLVAARSEAPASTTARGEFFRGWAHVVVPDSRCTVRLAGDALGQAPFAVDDRLTLIAHLPDGSVRRWMHEFRTGARIVPQPPTDVTAALGTDLRDLEIVLEDLEPPTFHNTDLWLLPCANGALPATPPAAAVGAVATPLRIPSVQPAQSSTARPTVVAPLVEPAVPVVPGAPDGSPVGWVVGAMAVFLLFAAAMLLLDKRAVRAAGRSGVLHLLTVYHATSGAQLQQSIKLADLPLGIALQPLRLVAAGAPDAVGILRVMPAGSEPVLDYYDAARGLEVTLDGCRLTANWAGGEPRSFAAQV